jgi:hypothetical protein
MGRGEGEFRLVNARTGEPRFRFFVWDMESTLSRPGVQADFLDLFASNSVAAQFELAIHENADFGLRFADCVRRHLLDGGALTPESTTARWASRAAEIETAVFAESARWGGVSPGQWKRFTGLAQQQYFPVQTRLIMDMLRNTEFYPSIEAPAFNQHGGSVAMGFELSIQNPSGLGTIYYTRDGSDPRLSGGDVSSNAAVFTGNGVPVNSPVQVSARILSDGEWSALNEATFTVVQVAPPQYRAGDANRDHRFDQADIIQVLQAAKYLTNEPADWAQGDWNGDGWFDRIDVVIALRADDYSPEVLTERRDDAYRVTRRLESGPGHGPLDRDAYFQEHADLALITPRQTVTEIGTWFWPTGSTRTSWST